MDSPLRNPLLPYRYKIAGYCLLIPGILLGIIRFRLGIKPAIFDWKVFAIYSSFFQKKFFTVITNNVTDEIAAVCCILGLSCIVFSQERIEIELYAELRPRAMYLAWIFNSGFLLSAVLFFYGIAFIYLLIAGMFSLHIFYSTIFMVLKHSSRKRINGTP